VTHEDGEEAWREFSLTAQLGYGVERAVVRRMLEIAGERGA
jgi:hypothetical protein